MVFHFKKKKSVLKDKFYKYFHKELMPQVSMRGVERVSSVQVGILVFKN